MCRDPPPRPPQLFTAQRRIGYWQYKCLTREEAALLLLLLLSDLMVASKGGSFGPVFFLLALDFPALIVE